MRSHTEAAGELKPEETNARPGLLQRKHSTQARRDALSLRRMVLMPPGVDEADFLECMRQRTEAVVAKEQLEGVDEDDDVVRGATKKLF